MVERIWVEVNARVNYPIKTALIDMMESGDFSLDNDSDKFCVSWFAIKVAAVGIELLHHGMSIQYQVLSEIKIYWYDRR